MKKILYGMMLATMFFATSCENELELGAAGEESVVSFTISTPDMGSRAYSDGTTATKLQYAVYNEQGNKLQNLGGVIENFDGSENIRIALGNGYKYSIIFWAADPNSPYTVDFGAKTMTVDYNDATSNDESRDAFYKYHEFTVNGAQTETIELKRPFAQLNIGANDFEQAANAGIVPLKSAVTVKSIYSTLNLSNGAVSDEVDVVFKDGDLPSGETFPVSGYEYLAMNYLLIGDDKMVVDVTFTITDKNDVSKTRQISSVPVQRNHRTNIYGQILTSDVDVNVDINPDFGGDDNYGNIDGQTYVKVDNVEDFYGAFENANVDIIILNENIVLNESISRAAVDPTLTVSKGKTLTIDLNGKMLSSTSNNMGKNYNMFDVRGTLTVKNGSMEYEHKGENMGWNNSTNLFNITDGGVVNLEDVIAKNLGGSDMAFVAHLNNWGEVTLNVNNSTLESIYIPVRVFNSGYDMNNVTIKNATLKGKYCFWVHNYTVADFGSEEKANAQKLLLNFDIYNSPESEDNNTFIFNNDKNAPVLYGFTDAVYFDEFGQKMLFLTPVDGAEGIAVDSDGNYYVSSAKAFEYIRTKLTDNNCFAGKTITLLNDISLSGEFSPIAPSARSGKNATSPGFKGVFDGNGKTIDGLTIKNGGANDAIGFFGVIDGGEVKNVNFTNVDINAPGCENAGTVAGLIVNGGKISDVSVRGAVVAKRGNGGIAGRILVNGTIQNCTNYANVSGTGANVAGIVGAAYYTAENYEMNLINCKNYGQITSAAGGVGGIVGLSSSNVDGCANYGVVTGNGGSVGGIAGEQSQAGSIIGCGNYADVTNANNAATGGIVGWTRYNGGDADYPFKEIIEISKNTNNGKISGLSFVGGISGQIYNYAIVQDNVNNAPSVTATNPDPLNGKAAGIVGYAYCADNVGVINAVYSILIKNNTSTTSKENISGAESNIFVNYDTNSAYIVLEGNIPPAN